MHILEDFLTVSCTDELFHIIFIWGTKDLTQQAAKPKPSVKSLRAWTGNNQEKEAAKHSCCYLCKYFECKNVVWFVSYSSAQ